MTIDWASLHAKLPTEKSSESDTEQRRQIFARYFDVNNNGYCSLAECDKGLSELLVSADDSNDGENNTMSIVLTKPVILRAFTSAKTIAQEKGDNINDNRSSDYLEFSEFRYFLLYLKEYIQLWELFDTIDGDNDRRISHDEFVNDLLPKLNNNEYYSRIFSETTTATTTTESIFYSIDTNNGGYILFLELAQYIIKHRMMALPE